MVGLLRGISSLKRSRWSLSPPSLDRTLKGLGPSIRVLPLGFFLPIRVIHFLLFRPGVHFLTLFLDWRVGVGVSPGQFGGSWGW